MCLYALPKQVKPCSSEAWGCNSDVYLALFLHDLKFYSLVDPADKAASSLHILIQFLCAFE